MKNIYFIILCASLVLAGCTSKEQDAKIKLFWQKQMMAVAEKHPSMLPVLLPLVMFAGVSQKQSQHQITVQEDQMPGMPEHLGESRPEGPSGEPIAPMQSEFVQNESIQNTHVQRGAVQTTHGQNKPVQRTPVQVLDVTAEDEVLPGKAPYQDRVHMTEAWTKMQGNNQILLKDLQSTFGEKVKNSAFYITLDTEQKLKKVAATSLTYKEYITHQQQIIAEQDKSIQKLMQQNTASLRRTKKRRTAR